MLTLLLLACTPTDALIDPDGDGFDLIDDCDDHDPDTYPGAPERCGDGVVNDCDATIEDALDICASEPVLSLEDAADLLSGRRQGDGLGAAAYGPGDLDGDGLAEVLVAAWWANDPVDELHSDVGAVHLVRSAIRGEQAMSEASATYWGDQAGSYFGTSIATGDLDGDGRPELVVGAYGVGDRKEGRVSVQTLHLEGEHSVSEAWWTVEGLAELDSENELQGEQLGWTVATGDLNGDGQDDLAIGAKRANHDSGSVYVFYGPLSPGAYHADEAPLQLTRQEGDPELSYGHLGSALRIADLDGDGVAELISGAPGADISALNQGAVFVFRDLPTAGVVPLREGLAILGPEAEGGEQELDGSHTGLALDVGDLDGDGLLELLVGSYLASEGAGGAHLIAGTALQTWLNLGEPVELATEGAGVVTFLGEDVGHLAGQAVSLPGDIDGDGLGDVAIAAPGWCKEPVGLGGTTCNAGAVYLFHSARGLPSGGLVPLADADQILRGEESQELAGQSLTRLGDVDGDGYDELGVGAPWSSRGLSLSGALYLVDRVGP